MSNLFQSKAESKNGSDRDHGLINHSIICLFRVVEKLAHVHSGVVMRTCWKEEEDDAYCCQHASG